MASFPAEGFRDIARRFRIAWAIAGRLRVRRQLAVAEGELGWLGWEQVDFYDEKINAEVEKVREFEHTQAALVNTSAEIGARKADLDRELAAEKARHEQTRAALQSERAPVAAQLEEAETRRRQKLDAAARFDRALEELAVTEKQLEARSRQFMEVANLDAAQRADSRMISDSLGRIPAERKFVLGDKATAAQEAADLEPEIKRLQADVSHLDSAIAAEDDQFAAASRSIQGEMRQLVREQKKSDEHMTHLDRKKHAPYRAIGACLADQGIAPRNQPEILEQVLTLRQREASLSESIAALQSTCATTSAGHLAAFYILLIVALGASIVLAAHIL